MKKNIDLGEGLVGVVTPFEPGIDAWAVQTTDGKVIHTGYAKDAEHAEALMRAFLKTGTAAIEEPKEKAAAAEIPAEPEKTEEVVAETEEPEEEAHKPKQGKLPADFPHHDLLEAGEVTTYAQLRKRIKDETLTELEGIGDARAAEIAEALGES